MAEGGKEGGNVIFREEAWFRTARNAAGQPSSEHPVIRPDVLTKGEVAGLYPEFGSLAVYSRLREEFIEAAADPTAQH